MRKSGVKGLGRLLSVLMVAALLMTTAMVPALAATWFTSTVAPHSSTALPMPASGRSVRSTVSISMETRPIRRVI